MLHSKHLSGIHAKVICDWEIRNREHIGTKSTFLFYFSASSVAWLWSGFLWAACERVSVREGVWAKERMPISCPCECDQRTVFLTCSVRAEWRCRKPVAEKGRMHALTAAGSFRCLCPMHYSFDPNEHHLQKACQAFIYLGCNNHRQFICVFGVWSFHLWENCDYVFTFCLWACTGRWSSYPGVLLSSSLLWCAAGGLRWMAGWCWKAVWVVTVCHS